ncbi:hypothetical protein IZU99_10435 [Oscillospiraceae bacterium CM]|nr:hypothetical protein IZU99_10435 [Oscillospiraceae bacterium CM]
MTFYQLSGALFPMRLGWFYFSMMGLAVFGLCFIGSIFAAQNQLFNAKDNELLLSLPVRPSDILIGRLASLLVLEYIFAAFIAVPAFVVWVVYQPVTILSIVFFMIAVLALPLGALALASLIAWLIALITSRLHNKNIATLVLSLLFLFGYFKVVSNINGYLNSLIQNGVQIAAAVQKALPPAYYLGKAIEDGRFWSLLVFLLSVLIPFAIMVFILSWNFIAITTANRGAAKIKYKEKALKSSGVRTAFTNKELRHFWSNPMYILNAGLGGAFMLAGAVLLVVNRSMVLTYLSRFNAAGLFLSPAILVCVALTAVSALNFVSAPSVSLEGKNLWIAKSLPVLPLDVLMAKVQLHLLVCGIPALLAGLICAVTLGVNFLEFLLLLALPLLMTLLTALFGVVMNLQFPKFDWINELQPIKQGLSVLITMFGAMAFIAALIVLYVVVLAGVFTVELYLMLCAVLFAVLSSALYLYLSGGGSRRFEALNN